MAITFHPNMYLKSVCQPGCIARFCLCFNFLPREGGGRDLHYIVLVKCNSVKLKFSVVIEMSDSDTDSDLAPSVYDFEDNLNCYGSPITNLDGECTESKETSNAPTINAAAAVERIESRQTQV